LTERYFKQEKDVAVLAYHVSALRRASRHTNLRSPLYILLPTG
jgi:hypothetical protein